MNTHMNEKNRRAKTSHSMDFSKRLLEYIVTINAYPAIVKVGFHFSRMYQVNANNITSCLLQSVKVRQLNKSDCAWSK